MTAPARTRTQTSRGGWTETDSKTRARSSTRARSAAAERAYARREERRAQRDTAERPHQQRTNAGQSQVARPKTKQAPAQAKKQPKATRSRVPLVVASMSILGVGLVTTLWLSIAAVGGSYELQQGEMEIEKLNQEKENLVLNNSSMSSTPALQRRAYQHGLGPGSPPAYLVRHPDGSTSMVGEPTSAPQAPQGSGNSGPGNADSGEEAR